MSTSNKFFKTLIITVILTRVSTASLTFLLGDNIELRSRIIEDPFHHYQLGLILVVIGLLFKRRYQKTFWFIPVGLGIFLEEIAVVFGDLGFGSNSYYHSGWDLLMGLMLIAIFWLITRKVTLK